MIRLTALLALSIAAPAAAQQLQPNAPTSYARAIAAGYKAAMYCSGIFNAGRTEAQIDADELRGIYPEYDAIVPTLAASVDRAAAIVTVAFDEKLPPRRAEWASGKGCTTLPIGSTASPRPAATRVTGPKLADPRPWPQGDGGITPKPSAAMRTVVERAFTGGFGEGSKTAGVVIVKDGRIVAEQYAAGFGPFVSNRTWSVAKSLAGALIGALQNRGVIDVKAPAAIPEWGREPADPRAAITNDQLLRMASGLHSDTAGNRTDAIYFGGTAVTEQATGWPIEAQPGTRFRYANNDTLLAVRSLAAMLQEDGASTMLANELFDAIGMRNTVAEADWRGNLILSSQVWSTARDLARFGLFLSRDGEVNGERLLPRNWMAESLAPVGPQPAGNGPGYGRTLWLFGPKQGLPEGSYAAQGNRGQYVMVIPSEKLVIVRRGEDPGGARFDVAKFSADVIAATK